METMTLTLPPALNRFKMSEAQRDSLRRDFDHHFFRIDISPEGQQPSHPGREQFDRINGHYNKPGIYLWVMTYGDSDDLFSIYIGKTKSLSTRVRNYRSEFQPHSPNDFKLRIFQSFLSEHVPDAALDLLFSPRGLDQLTTSENAAIHTYKPMLNIRQAATASARLGLQNAFEQYYRSAFETFLRGNAS